MFTCNELTSTYLQYFHDKVSHLHETSTFQSHHIACFILLIFKNFGC